MNFIRIYYFVGIVILIMSVITINIGIFLDNTYLVVGGVICFLVSILCMGYVTILDVNEENRPLLQGEIDLLPEESG